MKHPGDPSPRAPVDVMNDQLYRVIEYEGSRNMSGVESWHIVVFHCGTETYWSTRFLPAQISQPVQWQQVKPVSETSTVWRRVGATP